ncbi:hypothetical protein M758_3G002300 [Ceratodon purpureus]|nr:hypothetical protein M758_3G002300 [Ceratodon purpureus]
MISFCNLHAKVLRRACGLPCVLPFRPHLLELLLKRSPTLHWPNVLLRSSFLHQGSTGPYPLQHITERPTAASRHGESLGIYRSFLRIVVCPTQAHSLNVCRKDTAIAFPTSTPNCRNPLLPSELDAIRGNPDPADPIRHAIC